MTVRSAAIRVERFRGDPAEWDAFVATQADATHCHAFAWREVMEDVLGHECVYLCAVDEGGETVGALPLVRVRSRLTGDRLISMPFLNAGGPVGSVAARRALAARGLGLARRLGVDVLELRVRRSLDGWPASGHKVRVTIRLTPDIDAVWRAFPSKLRSQVRRPLKDGMVARFGPEHLDAFHDVLSRNMRRLGTPVLPAPFFGRAVAALGDAALVGVVYAGGRPVAAGFGVRWGRELELTWASSLREFARSSPNMLLYWSFMERAAAAGAEVFDFGRSSPGTGPHRFKLQWGGEDEILPWARWSAGGEPVAAYADRRALRWASLAWRRLPLSVTRRLGPRLARLLP